MKRWLGAVAGVVLAACGPPIPEVVPDAGGGCTGNCEEPPVVNQSLWPMTTGSSWTYRITDPVKGVFEKTVTVAGEQAVPDLGTTAILFKSVQPFLQREERSWQVADGPFAKRVREEDINAGSVVRITTWEPSTIKALTTAQAAGWENRLTVQETVQDLAAGATEVKQKEFVWQVLAVDQDVVVGGTTHKALKVQRSREDKEGKERIYWLVPGVGKVREEGERTEELLQFEVK